MSTAMTVHVQAFLAVSRLSSFSAAARELGVSRSAVSQSVRQLEEQLGVLLLTRTTRSLSLTEAGRRLVETAGPALGQLLSALREVGAEPGETVARLRLSVPRIAYPLVIGPVVPRFRDRHPRIEVELVFEDRLVDIVGGGFDAGIRLEEYLERDMVGVRLTDAFRFIVVGAPSYLERRGTPERPEDLLKHECLTFRSESTGSLYAWELERGRRSWRVPVRGGIVVNDGLVCTSLAEQGLGLAYVAEPLVTDQIRNGRLLRVLEPFAADVPGLFLYYPTRSQHSSALRLLVETARDIGPKASSRKVKTPAG
jgi:DNA-binding transcriptional LysR family regulator